MATFISRNARETEEFGQRFAASCARGDVVALAGDLGTGKTQFVKGVVAGTGCESPVTSPTFTLIHEYSGGRLPIYHFDLYRIADAHELDRIGVDEYFEGDGICLVEWADRFAEAIPKRARWIDFREAGNESREITMREQV